MTKITILLLLLANTVFAGGDLIFKGAFEPGITRIALSKDVGNDITHVGWLDIDTNVWFDITAYFDETYGANGEDSWITMSSDLRYYLIETERPPAYQGHSGLAWGTLDEFGIPSEPVVVDGEPHPDGLCTISAEGLQIAMVLRDESDRTDVWVVNRAGNTWLRDSEVNISSASTGNNFGPQFSRSEDKIIWTSHLGEGRDFDENSADGMNFTHLLSHTDIAASAKIFRPSYENGGTIVFERDFQGESCYRWNPTTPAMAPVVIDAQFNNDNSCAALPDTRIISFWLERPGTTGQHEIRLMQADGTHIDVLQLGVDFFDDIITGGTYFP